MNNKGYSYKPFKVDNKLQQGKVFNIMGIFMHDTGPHGKFSDSVLLVKTKNDMEGCFFVLIYCAAWKMYMMREMVHILPCLKLSFHSPTWKHAMLEYLRNLISYIHV